MLASAGYKAKSGQAHPATRLLTHMQRAGMTLHVGARVKGAELDMLGIAPPATFTAHLIFLLSREGQPLAYAAPALRQALEEEAGKGEDGMSAELVPCAAHTASQLLRGEAGAGSKLKASVGSGVTVDMYSYTAFALKSDLL